MEFYPNGGHGMLSDSHRHMLEAGSAIWREVYEESGVQSITHGRQLPRGFSKRQRKRGSGILFTVPRPNGETSWSFRPDQPDPKDPGRKYEQPSKHYGGPGNVLYVHPSQRHLISDTSVPVIFTEGIKKALSIITAARRAGASVLVVAISGVWNFLSDGELIADMLEIPVEGREVDIVFDSPDILTNPSVQGAAVRLAEAEISRGAAVRMAFLPDKPGGEKVGADDFLVSGKTYGELRMTMRSYDPGDFELIRFSRDARISAIHEDLKRRHSDTIWSWRGAKADSNIYQALAARARKHGKIHVDGIRVEAAWAALALEAKIGSSRTVGKGISRLEERGLLYRDNAGRKEGRAGHFVLRASVKHIEGTGSGETASEGSDPCTLHPRSPRLWASRPKFKPTKKMIRKHREGTLSYLPEPREGVTRLGKERSHALDRLDDADGTLALDELARLMGVKRPRDLVRRKRSEKGRNGLLVWLEEAGIVSVDGDTASLTPDWLGRLEEQRERGEELDADEQAKSDRKRRNDAYRDYLQRKGGKLRTSKPSAEGLQAVERSHEQRRAGLAAIAERKAAAAKTEELRKAKAFVRDTLKNDKLLVSGGIRLGHLCDIWRDEGGDSLAIQQAVEELSLHVERLAGFDNEPFVFAPAEAA